MIASASGAEDIIGNFRCAVTARFPAGDLVKQLIVQSDFPFLVFHDKSPFSRKRDVSNDFRYDINGIINYRRIGIAV